MVYAEVMLGKHVNWSTMMAHSSSNITVDTIDIPTDVDWNGGLMQHAITNGLLRQGWAAAVETTRSLQVHTGMEDRAWIIILRAAVNNTGAGNHGICKAGRGVISTEHGMITTRAERLNTRM
jgi:hypothetical protein